MSLTSENMRTDPKGEVISDGAMYEDLTKMDQDQLGRYVRRAFLGETDLDFLPEPFWWNFDTYSDGLNLHTAPDPGTFFGGFYHTLGRMEVRGETGWTTDKGVEYTIDFGFYTRLEKVLKDIFDELLTLEGEANESQRLMGKFAMKASRRMGLREEDVEGLYQGQKPEEIKVDRIEMITRRSLEHRDLIGVFTREQTLTRDPRYST